jgi:hypothetical protein
MDNWKTQQLGNLGRVTLPFVGGAEAGPNCPGLISDNVAFYFKLHMLWPWQKYNNSAVTITIFPWPHSFGTANVARPFNAVFRQSQFEGIVAMGWDNVPGTEPVMQWEGNKEVRIIRMSDCWLSSMCYRGLGVFQNSTTQSSKLIFHSPSTPLSNFHRPTHSWTGRQGVIWMSF